MTCRERWTVSGDGTSLAFCDEGDGPVVILTNGYANSHLYWEPLRRRLKQNYRVIRWDLRGHGRSGPARDMKTMTVEGCADDLRRVLDAAEVERATLSGFSFGCQIVLEAWRNFPHRIEGLIPILGPYERPFDTLIHPRIGPLIFEIYRMVPPWVWKRVMRFGMLSSRVLIPIHEVAKTVGIIGKNVSFKEMEPFYRHLAQLHIPSWYVMGLAAQDHSARDLLRQINVPTLVVAGGGDRFSPGRLGREMAESIPDAELVWLETATHTGLFDDREMIGDEVERFLDDVFGNADVESSAASVR